MCGGKKNVFVAYILWFFLGWLGVHHFYLKRDRQAFVWWSTLGGLGVAWLGEMFTIPQYVRQANDDQNFVAARINAMRRSPTPPFSLNQFTSQILLAYVWGTLTLNAIPIEPVLGFNMRFLIILVPLAVALAVWTVGNMDEKEEGGLKVPLLAAYMCFPFTFLVYQDSTWLLIVVVASSTSFEMCGKTWRRRKVADTHCAKRLAILGACGILYISLWGSYVYFQGTITDSEGVEIPIYEALEHFFTSPWWVDLQQSLYEVYQYAQHHGWYEIWKQIIELSDPHGIENAYKVLGVTPNTNQQELTTTWRRLSKANHPDKVKDPALKRQAQETFMEIQKAYEILSKSKNRRQRQNKKDNS